MGLIRLFLALVVVADHVNVFHLQQVGLEFSGYFKLGLSGPSAVMFFYMISGFLISYALSHKYPADNRGTAAFYKSRFVRIFSVYWPLFWLMVLFNYWGARAVFSTPLSTTCGITVIGADWAVAFADYPTAYWGCFPQALGQAWTLGAELTFYALAPFLLRNNRAALAALIASVAVRAGILATIGASDNWTYYFFPATMCFFLTGHFTRVVQDRWPLPRVFSWFMLLCACLLSLPSTFELRWENPHFYAAAFCFAVALPGVFATTKNSRILTWIGDLSFPLYLIHMTVVHTLLDPPSWTANWGIALMHWSVNLHDPKLGGAVVTGAVAASCIAAAIFVHYAIERPCGKLLAAGLKLATRTQLALSAAVIRR